MKALIDTIFNPILNWLQTIIDYLNQASIPLSRPLDISQYFGVFQLLGSEWTLFITTTCSLAFIYMVIYIVVNSYGLYSKFKSAVKWW